MVVTIKDLAKKLHVSPATVSLALNDNPAINQETARKVKEAAQSMGYIRNHYARGLARRRSGSIALVLPDVENQYFASVIHHVANECKAAGYDMTIAITHDEAEEEWHILRRLCQEHTEAILLVPTTHPPKSSAYLHWLQECKVPLIFVTARYAEVDAPLAMCDLKRGMRTMTEYILSLGLTDTALLTGEEGVETLDMRREGYMEVLQEHDLAGKFIHLETVAYQQAYDQVSAMCREELPEALLCINDMVALGAINALHDMHLRVPEDISVSGFDDSIFSRISGVPVSTVRQDVAQISRQAVALALYWIRDSKPPQGGLLPCDLVIRRSTACCSRRKKP